MTWSGREAFLARWVPRFHDAEFARREVDKYVSGSFAPDDARADSWMQRALGRDQDLAAIAADPENYAIGPSRYDLNGCAHCHGRGFVRLELPPSHAEFGKAKLCSACAGRAGDRSAHCPQCATFSDSTGDRNRCYTCRQFEDEHAGERCANPVWHTPGGLPAAHASLATVLKKF